MHVTVLGANGLTGRLLTAQLLSAGHTVNALTRHPEQLELANGLTITAGDATRVADLRAAVHGAQAVVSVLGVPYSKQPISLYSASAKAIIEAMTEAGIRRVVLTSSQAATSWEDPHWTWLQRNLVSRILDSLGRTLYDDMRLMETIVARTDLDWTVMRPLGLANMDPPTEYAVAEDHISGSQTARRDLAAAILDQLTSPDFIGKAVAVATTNKTVSIPATIWREGIKPKFVKG
jgi:putative NADH-flavin reductase